MKVKKTYIILLIITINILIGCDNDNTNQPGEDCINRDFFTEYSSRNFNMGFSTWPYEKTIESVENTYQFISEKADIYSEHIDYNIPWNAWINDLALPAEFTDDITTRVSRKITNAKLTLSVSLLNKA